MRVLPFVITKEVVVTFTYGRKPISASGANDLYLQMLQGRVFIVKVSRLNVPHGKALLANEAKMLSIVNHPNILSSYAYWEIGRKGYLVCEYMDAMDIASQRRGGIRITVEEAMHIVKRMAMALAHIHEKGIVHADVKPGNILWMRKGNLAKVKLSDFAFARPAGQRLGIDPQKEFGTPGYLSIDRLAGNPPRENDDVFALGISFFEMLSGETALKEPKEILQLGARMEALDIPQGIKELLFKMTGTFPLSPKVIPPSFADGLELLKAME